MRLVLALCLTLSFATTAPAQKVLLVDLDDVGDDLIADATTPVLDRLAASGRQFTEFYVCPSCSPTRARMNLGFYGMRRENLIGRVILAQSNAAMPLSGTTLAGLLRDAGHQTAKVGKWHLAPIARVEHPTEAGYLHYAGVLSNIVTAGIGYYDYTETIDGVSVPISGEYLTTRETNHALRFVRAGYDLISLSYHAVHAPLHEPPADLYTGMTPTTDREFALAMLEALDTELGRLLREAIPAGYTIIVFSDNGTVQWLGGDKGSVYEGGVNTYCAAFGPGVVPGVDHSLVDVVDIFATTADLFEIPLAAGQASDSVSFYRALRGEPGLRRWNYTEQWPQNGRHPAVMEPPSLWIRAVRGPRYKLVRNQDVVGDRFFDLLVDPGETNDLIGNTTAVEQQALLSLRAVLHGL